MQAVQRGSGERQRFFRTTARMNKNRVPMRDTVCVRVI